MNYKLRNKNCGNHAERGDKGFTLLELLVVLGITLLLSAGLIFYNRTSENQLLLFRDQQKIISALQRAKSFSLETFSQAEAPCGYGVNFSLPNTVVIFKDLSPSSDPQCSDIDFVYSGDSKGDCQNYAECVEKIYLDKNVKFSELGLNNIVFIPPNPNIIIDKDPNKAEALIKIKSSTGQTEKIIKVNNRGQITAQ